MAGPYENDITGSLPSLTMAPDAEKRLKQSSGYYGLGYSSPKVVQPSSSFVQPVPSPSTQQGQAKNSAGMNLAKTAATLAGVGGVLEAGMGIYQLINAQRMARDFEPISQLGYEDIQRPIQQNIEMQQRRAQEGISAESEDLIKRRQASLEAGLFRRASEQGQAGAALSAIANMDRYKMSTELGFAEEQAKVQAESQLAQSRAQMAGLLGQQKREEDASDAAYLNEITKLRYQGLANISGAVTGSVKALSNLAYMDSISDLAKSNVALANSRKK